LNRGPATNGKCRPDSMQPFVPVERHHGVIGDVEPSRTSDEGLFDAFYRERRARAVGLAHLLTGSRAVGEEVAQDAFVVIHAKWEELVDRDAYLRTVIVNLSRTVQRRQIRERLHLARGREEISTTPSIDETWTIVRRLPADQRAVVVLRYYEDLPLAAIAVVLGQPLGTVKSHLHRATRRLKGSLHD
jgi:RNA polymerase sigma factor (sigma-70 family)